MDNLRRFLVVFTTMFFIAAAVCGFILARSYSNTSGELVDSLPVAAPTYDPNTEQPQGTIFKGNIFCIVGDKDKPETELLFIMNVDTSTGNLSLLFIPKDVKYGDATSSRVGAFGSLYSSYMSAGAQQTASLAASFFDIDIPYYISLGTEDFGKLISTFSSEDQGVSFTIPVDLEYRDSYYNISLVRGTRYIKGDEAAQLVSFYHTADEVYTADMLQYYNGSDVMRVRMSQRFIQAFLTQKFIAPNTEVYKEQFTELFLPYLTKGETNLTDTDISALSAVFKNLTADKVNYYMLTGDTVFNDRIYIEYKGYMQNMLLDEAVSTVRADDILKSRFVG